MKIEKQICFTESFFNVYYIRFELHQNLVITAKKTVHYGSKSQE